MPTIPSPRDTTRSSLGNHTPRTPGSKSIYSFIQNYCCESRHRRAQNASFFSI